MANTQDKVSRPTFYEYSNPISMQVLGHWLRRTVPAHRVTLAAGIMAEGLLRTHLWLTLRAKIMVWREGQSPAEAWTGLLLRRPDVASAIIEKLAKRLEVPGRLKPEQVDLAVFLMRQLGRREARLRS